MGPATKVRLERIIRCRTSRPRGLRTFYLEMKNEMKKMIGVFVTRDNRVIVTKVNSDLEPIDSHGIAFKVSECERFLMDQDHQSVEIFPGEMYGETRGVRPRRPGQPSVLEWGKQKTKD